MAKEPGSYVRSEIVEQPDVVARLVADQRHVAQAVSGEIARRGIRYVTIAARGTSDNAARYAQYLWGALGGLNVGLATPSLWSVYDRPPWVGDSLVVGISQSGQSPDIVAVVADAAAQGAMTLAITNEPDSPLAQVATHVMLLGAGVERAVAATKTYTAQLVAVALIGAAISDEAARWLELDSVSAAMRAALAVDEPAREVAGSLADVTQCLAIGRGYNLSTTFELALKLQEMCYVTVGQYSSADFRHGPMALASPEIPAIVVAPSGAVAPSLQELVGDLADRGVDVVAISDLACLGRSARALLALPQAVPEWLSPMTAILPGQLLALHIALAKGIDPDVPRGLSKVTLTL